jgi:hypothetical protein
MSDTRSNFLRGLDSAERWLARYFSDPGQRPAAVRMVRALAAYIRQCRRYGTQHRADEAELRRRLRKIEDACLILWKSRLGQ